MRPKRMTRPGGQPDGSSYTGAWGGWALAPNTASMGRDYRSHRYRSREGRRTFKRPAKFFNFCASIFWQASPKLLRGGAMGFANGRLVGRHGGTRRAQVSGRGNILTNLDFFSGWGARNRGNRR